MCINEDWPDYRDCAIFTHLKCVKVYLPRSTHGFTVVDIVALFSMDIRQ